MEDNQLKVQFTLLLILQIFLIVGKLTFMPNAWWIYILAPIECVLGAFVLVILYIIFTGRK